MKETYDVVVVGGGIAGSIAARFSAQHGFKTLLIERAKTPRNKPCSGIQFPYLEKLIGEKVPREILCQNELNRVEMVTPSGRVVKGRMKMLNFWRSTFDSWLNSLAVRAGSAFYDESRFVDLRIEPEWIALVISSKGSEKNIRTRYLIGADGLNSAIRRKLRPQDFTHRSVGAAINYYFAGEANMDPDTLYMFYSRDFSPLMFAWVYMKDNQWVVGTGADKEPLAYAERFLTYVRERYNLRAQLVRKEGFSSPMESTVYLGCDRVLMAGDAAGLVDLYRGLGMDNAALSGRLAVKAIVETERIGCMPIEVYQRLMSRVVRQIEKNGKRQAARYTSNEALEDSLSTFNLVKDGMLMLAVAQLNKVLPPENVIMLPL
jgi:geranylgeranyl reductase family protein